METGNLIIFLVAVTLIVSFLIGTFMDPIADCEQQVCKCFVGGRSDEIDCNACVVWDPIMVSGIVNYGKTCNAREIYLCDEDKQLGIRYDFFDDSCEKGMKMFSMGP